MQQENKKGDSISTTVELRGKYTEIRNILSFDDYNNPELRKITEEMDAVLEAIKQSGGSTKGQIPEQLPNAAVKFDEESIIHLLRVLELYDMVELDGNTWRPGPEISIE